MTQFTACTACGGDSDEHREDVGAVQDGEVRAFSEGPTSVLEHRWSCGDEASVACDAASAKKRQPRR